MTLPIVTVVHTDEMRRDLMRAVTVAYYLPEQHQAQPPRPFDADIIIEEWPAAIIYSRWVASHRHERFREVGKKPNQFPLQQIHLNTPPPLQIYNLFTKKPFLNLVLLCYIVMICVFFPFPPLGLSLGQLMK